MSKLERYKKELLGLEDRTELMKDLIRKEEEAKESECSNNEWDSKHAELVSKIKQHTRPFQKGEDNYCFVRKYRYGVPELDINLYSSLDVGCEYDYFASKDEALKFMYNSTKELLLKYLFKPADGDYKAVMEEGE